MVSKSKYLTAVTGVIFTVIGAFISIPFFLNEHYLVGGIGTVLVVIGLILFAIAFGD